MGEDSTVGEDPEGEETVLAGWAAAAGGYGGVGAWHRLAWHLPALHPTLLGGQGEERGLTGGAKKVCTRNIV